MIPFKRITTVESEKSIFGVSKQYYFSDGILMPNKAIKGNKIYKVSIIDPAYKIFSLTVTTVNDRLKFVHANVLHPNVNPENLLYCLASHYQNQKYSTSLVETLMTTISTYYLDTCYFDAMQVNNNQLIFEEQLSMRFNGKGEVIT
jgi:hypothetical protein